MRFRLSERVPRHNLYRRLDEVLDLRFLYEETQALYRHTGQPSLGPVVFFKLLLVGRLENIARDRRLLAHCALRLDILLFLGYGLDEELPGHSTVSRTRQRYPASLFEQLFDRVFRLCVAQGLMRPRPTRYAARLPVRPSTARRLALGGKRPKARSVSNKTPYSSSDPEARVSIKPGKARALNYRCSLAVDPAKGIISHLQADSRDSLPLPGLVKRLQASLTTNEVPLREVVADAR